MRNFAIAEPMTVDQAVSFLAEKKGSYFLMAGGTDLLGEIKDEIIKPDGVVDLKSISGLSYIIKEKTGVRIGPLTSLVELTENSLIKRDYPGLFQAADSVATPQIRNIGTVGGNICQRPRCWYYRDPQVHCRKKGGTKCFAFRGRNKYHAIFGGKLCYMVHPSDLAPALISLDAEVSIASTRGERTMALADFFVLPQINVRRENVLSSSEVLKEIRLPLVKPGEKSSYYKLMERGSWDFALVSAAVKGVLFGRVFNEIKIVAGGVAPVPWRMTRMENLIVGKKITENLLKQAAREALKEARPLRENKFKKDLVEVAVSRAVLSLVK